MFSSVAIFAKPYGIMAYCSLENLYNFGVDPSCSNWLNGSHF